MPGFAPAGHVDVAVRITRAPATAADATYTWPVRARTGCPPGARPVRYGDVGQGVVPSTLVERL
ncbi:hypothetical protein CFC35_41605 [Streptomyces sp. FBKL.4005]|uniref:hypothetical protein n=1 Tax=Streptomyces sp. FBKL.4005 TaxID=2015515 RepID=UPI000B95F1F3|nr:hypothetical protein [Streptomyces sp. FBKL.4005]OYP10125.1 hypothetical protein CFC35_41540 [Streptomyces sp. FBKL.4005]OYP10129.1 hypothetical protein CFC35_41560 [Streptomyces sp. FBKL.4005]OYP10138.1 hypothetical protein CFC35_41605 [Streptomyces sp. FBKL.4005]